MWRTAVPCRVELCATSEDNEEDNEGQSPVSPVNVVVTVDGVVAHHIRFVGQIGSENGLQYLQDSVVPAGGRRYPWKDGLL